VKIVDGFVEVALTLAERVELAEDRVLAGHPSEQSSELAQIRRVLARLRRHVAANRGLLAALLPRIGRLCTEDQRQELHETIERLDAAREDMELITERARLLQEEIASRLGEATNKNLYVLSIVTTALLPITLITGVFGMNVGGLPFLESKHGFYWVLFGMLLTVGVTLLLLRRARPG
jgi:zinc transporter